MKQTEIFNKKPFYFRTPLGKGWEKRSGTIVYFVTDDDLRVVLGIDKRGKYYYVTDVRTGLSIMHAGIRYFTNRKALIYTLEHDTNFFDFYKNKFDSTWYTNAVDTFIYEVKTIDPDFYNDIEGMLFPYYKI